MKLVFPVLLCLLFASCFNEGDCLISATNFIHIQFKKKSNHTVDTLVLFNYIYFVGTDSGISKFQASEILLPVNINADSSSTGYIFQISSLDSTLTENDTLRVSYARQSKVITKDCGAYTFYNDLKITESTFGSNVKAYSTSLIKDPTTSGFSSYAINYQIYF
ncbi:MAG: DUF6452 family protein [Cyclobacteriaceae bacterium]